MQRNVVLQWKIPLMLHIQKRLFRYNSVGYVKQVRGQQKVPIGRSHCPKTRRIAEKKEDEQHEMCKKQRITVSLVLFPQRKRRN